MKQSKLLFLTIIMAVELQGQTPAKESKTVLRGGFGIWSLDAGFLASANAKNSKESKPLFAGNGYSAGVAYRWGDRWGIQGRAGYAGGKTSTKNAQTFANGLVAAPFTAKQSGLKSNWNQFTIAAGPSVMLGKNYKGAIYAAGGVSYGGATGGIVVNKYDAQTNVATVFTAIEKKVKPYWAVQASYELPFGKGRIGLKTGYDANGAIVGIVLKGKHMCLICGGRHRGKCKYGYADMANAAKQQNDTLKPVLTPSGGHVPTPKRLMAIDWGRRGKWPFCHPAFGFCRGVQKETELDLPNMKLADNNTIAESEIVSQENGFIIRVVVIKGEISRNLVEEFQKTKSLELECTYPEELLKMQIENLKGVKVKSVTCKILSNEIKIVNNANAKDGKTIIVIERGTIAIDNKVWPVAIVTASKKHDYVGHVTLLK